MALSRRYPKWLSWIMYALVLLTLYLGLRAWNHRDLQEGFAPRFAAQTISDDWIAFPTEGTGPMLLYFWATWCPICRFEQGAIDAIADDWPVLTVAYKSGDREQIGAYMRENKVDFPVIADPHGRIAARFGVTAVPVSFIVDASGAIRFREVGFTSGPGLRARLWWVNANARFPETRAAAD